MHIYIYIWPCKKTCRPAAEGAGAAGSLSCRWRRPVRYNVCICVRVPISSTMYLSVYICICIHGHSLTSLEWVGPRPYTLEHRIHTARARTHRDQRSTSGGSQANRHTSTGGGRARGGGRTPPLSLVQAMRTCLILARVRSGFREQSTGRSRPIRAPQCVVSSLSRDDSVHK